MDRDKKVFFFKNVCGSLTLLAFLLLTVYLSLFLALPL